MYGNHPNGSPEMGKIIAEYHCDRLKKLIDSSKGEIVCGGRVERDIKYVEPTIILNPDTKSPVM
jgi:acyl-CoA reductase-like NAD-dependent aldehyde dehydrogenase